MSSTVKAVLHQLEALGNAKVRELQIRNGAGTSQYGVPLGDIRKVAAQYKNQHELGLQLWTSGNVDAQLTGILLLKPKLLSAAALEQMVRDTSCAQVADWLSSYVVKQHPEKEALRLQWMEAQHPWLARAGWSLTWERINKNPDGLDLPALLDRIEQEAGNAPSDVQWTMNFCLGSIGINEPTLRKRAIALGEKLGMFRDYPVSKGCTSPYVPIWVNEMVRRQG